MQQAPLFTLLISTIETGLRAQGLVVYDDATPAGIVVQQGYQPSLQGTPSAPTAALYCIANRRYGWLRRHDKWVPAVGDVPGYMAHEESQWMETTFQVTALAPQVASVTDQLAATDLATAVADALQSDAGREMLRAAGVGILRITNTRVGNFMDDRDRNEYAPNFDFTVTHENVRLSSNQAVEDFEFNLQRV